MSQALTLRFGADTSGVTRAMRDMVASSAGQLQTLRGVYESTAVSATAPWLRGLGSIVGAIGPVRLAMLGLAAASLVGFQASADKLKEYTDLLVKARDLGVSTEFLQGFTAQVEKFGLKTADAEAALKRFQEQAKKGFDSASFSETDSPLQKKLDELFTDRVVPAGSGAGRQDFQAATSAEGQVRGVIKAVQELQGEGQRLAALDLAETAFGGGAGAKFAQEIEQGTVNIEKMIATGIANGSIISNKSAEEAGELTRRLGDAADKARDGLMPILQDIASLRLPLYNFAVVLAEALAEVARQAGVAYTAIKRLPTKLEGSNLSGDVTQDAAQAAFGGIITPTDIARPASEPLVVTVGGSPSPPRRPLGLGGPPPPKRGGGRSSSPSEEIDKIEKFITGQQKANALLQAEIDGISKGNDVKERALALAKAKAIADEEGITLTDKQIAAITNEAAATARLKDEKDALKAAQDAVNDSTRFFGQLAISNISELAAGGESAARAFEMLKKNLVQALLQAALLGDGPLAGAFGTKGSNGGVGGLFGLVATGIKGFLPSFDVGTSRVPRDMVAQVHKDEMIIPAYDANRLRNGSGASPSITLVQNISANGDVTVARIAGQAAMAAVQQSQRGEAARAAERQWRAGG